QNAGAPKLGVSEPFAIEPGGQRHGNSRAKELEALGERDSDFTDRHVVQNVSERNADDRGDDQDQVRFHPGMNRSSDFAEGEGQRKQQYRSNETHYAEAPDRSKLR